MDYGMGLIFVSEGAADGSADPRALRTKARMSSAITVTAANVPPALFPLPTVKIGTRSPATSRTLPLAEGSGSLNMSQTGTATKKASSNATNAMGEPVARRMRVEMKYANAYTAPSAKSAGAGKRALHRRGCGVGSFQAIRMSSAMRERISAMGPRCTCNAWPSVRVRETRTP